MGLTHLEATMALTHLEATMGLRTVSRCLYCQHLVSTAVDACVPVALLPVSVQCFGELGIGGVLGVLSIWGQPTHFSFPLHLNMANGPVNKRGHAPHSSSPRLFSLF